MLFLSACSSSPITVAEIQDGDTLTLQTGEVIRLVQIDTPELASNECYAQEAKEALIEFVAVASEQDKAAANELKTLRMNNDIEIIKDELLDAKDSYDRTLAYVFIKGLNINIELVKNGFATPYFFNGEKGQYATELSDAADYAKENGLGIWSACPAFTYDPDSALSTGVSSSASDDEDNDRNYLILNSNKDPNCSPGYVECVPPYPPDYDCSNLRALGLIHVVGPDPHRLDRDGDGLACESNSR